MTAPTASAPLTRRLVLTPAAAVALAATLALVSLALGLFNERSSRIDSAHQAQVQADILASSVAGALAFDDKATTQEFVDALQANPDVEAAAAYDSAGRLAAQFHRAGAPAPASNTVAPAAFNQARLQVTAPVRQGSTPLGSVYLRLSIDSPMDRLGRYLPVGAIILMASLLVGMLGSSHARLRDAHARLQREIGEREKAEDALRQAQKMEAMGQLTGGVAHDFNNLLMVASSGLDLMDRTQDTARRERLKQGIRQAIDRGASLTQQLLAFSRRAPVKPRVIDPGEALRGMLNLLDRSLREDVTVTLDIAPDIWPVEVDVSAFEVAILNAAINSRDAMPSGGSITIAAANAPALSADESDRVLISVTDTGEGMSAELAPRVFEPFFTTKEVGQGTGLGLSQVYGFVRSSGGQVEFLSELGVGSTLRLHLPRCMKTPPLEQAVAIPPPRPMTERRRVLLVEDDDAVAGLVREMLDDIGYDSERAPNAALALDILRAQPDFDLVFSDMVMPGDMNGLELAEAIAAQWPDLPVVLTTGYSAAAASAAAKGVRLLLKPYRIEALAKELEAALNAEAAS